MNSTIIDGLSQPTKNTLAMASEMGWSLERMAQQYDLAQKMFESLWPHDGSRPDPSIRILVIELMVAFARSELLRAQHGNE